MLKASKLNFSILQSVVSNSSNKEHIKEEGDFLLQERGEERKFERKKFKLKSAWEEAPQLISPCNLQ